MTRQKIIFAIVLIAVGLFIASMVGSMFARRQVLPNGYALSVGGRGEIWLRSPDGRTLTTDVTSVWTSPDRMLVERHTTDEKPPFKLLDCDYQVADGRGPLRPIMKAEALAMLGSLERQSASAKTCVQ
ncbi:hypothetical protein [Caulobacter sp. RL271]|uniref:Uncharacterized protein n=1 Tax=Caulobacter segnis TaxID=88688 RepID=A0ABY4ZTC0_9CAUL|nr:hypothetical protein [Caulobacter segnis]USQ96068.1 hypothetical protein MZV50_00215 [Caulobacter segnis]